MTTPTNWPNPERPGAPLFPERDGLHVVLFNTPSLGFWMSKDQCWGFDGEEQYFDPGDAAGRFSYIGPALTPTQIADMLAGERERVEAEMGTYVKNIMNAQPEWNMEQLHSALKEREAIRNLGDAP